MLPFSMILVCQHGNHLWHINILFSALYYNVFIMCRVLQCINTLVEIVELKATLIITIIKTRYIFNVINSIKLIQEEKD